MQFTGLRLKGRPATLRVHDRWIEVIGPNSKDSIRFEAITQLSTLYRRPRWAFALGTLFLLPTLPGLYLMAIQMAGEGTVFLTPALGGLSLFFFALYWLLGRAVIRIRQRPGEVMELTGSPALVDAVGETLRQLI